MILEALTLNNFGLFRGIQSLDLRPTRRNGIPAPIILFGGMNGSGKTTVLDAIQLALYGGRAQCSKRAGLSYDAFLRQGIHESQGRGSRAGVGLRFRYSENGEDCTYEVQRSWEANGEAVREALTVTKNGVLDSWLSENWSQIVDDLIPFGLSQLFFLDGEKIRALAEESTARDVLESSIKSLLGLDIVERLLSDATIVQTRLLKRSTDSDGENEAIEQLQADYQRALDELAALKSERAGLENDRLRAEEAVLKSEDEFRRSGGQYWAQRETMTRELAALEARRQQLREHLLSLAAGDLPLAVLRTLLKQVATQASHESKKRLAGLLRSTLKERDKALVQMLTEKNEHESARLVAAWLEADRREREKPLDAGAVDRLGLSDATSDRLRFLLSQQLATVTDDASRSVSELESTRERLEGMARSQSAVPEERSIAPIAAVLQNAASERAALNEKARRLDEEIRTKTNYVTKLEQTLRNRLDVHVKGQFQSEDAMRLAGLAGRARGVLEKFLVRATETKIERLSETITESFRFLLRKQSLIQKITIDPAAFEIELLDHDGRTVPKHRLSEGEKQIFAIAVLWGLGKCSSRPLPAVIDTPMARLDTAHRGHLIDRYFPNASHQVIILSTDTEVDEEHYRSLEPYIARAFFLEYNEGDRATTAHQGYFWQSAGDLVEAVQ